MRIVAQVLDSTYGESAVGVRARMTHASGSGWSTVAEAETDNHGYIHNWGNWSLRRGLYRIVFDSDSYFALLGATSIYPEVTITFRVVDDPCTFRIRITLSPYSYSAYFSTTEATADPF